MASGRIWFEDDGNLRGYIDWESHSNGPSANSSDVTAVSYVYKEGSSAGTLGTWEYHLQCAGEDDDGDNYTTVYDDPVEMGRIEITVEHQSDGTRWIQIGGWIDGPSGTTQAGRRVEGYEWVELDRINRYPVFTRMPYITSRTINTLSFNYGSLDISADLYYSLNNRDWTHINSTITTIHNLNPNINYTIYVQARNRDDSSLRTTVSITGKTYDIAHITQLTDFIHGNDTYITISNSSSASMQLKMSINEIEILTMIPQNGENIIHYTQEQLDNIYKKYPNDSNELDVNYSLITTNDNKNYTDMNNCIITLEGNQKTIKTKVNNEWQRGKIWVKINNEWRQAVVWSKENNEWHRCI